MSLILIAILVLSAALAVSGALHVKLRRRKRRSQPLSYFIRGLGDRERELLRQSGIPFGTHALDDDPGALFDAVHLKTVLRALNAREIASFPLHGNDICELVVHFKPEKDSHLSSLTVTAQNRLRRGERYVLSMVREILLPCVRTNIVVHVGNSTTRPVRDGDFHLILNSGARTAARAPAMVWGVPTFQADGNAFLPSGKGLTFVDKRSTFAVAELIDNSLFIHLDVLRGRNQALLVRILQNIAPALQAELSVDVLVRSAISAGTNSDARTEKLPFSIAVNGLNARQESIVRSLVAQILLPAVKSDITVWQPKQRHHLPQQDGSFHVFLHAAAINTPSQPAPHNVWERRPVSLLYPSGLGMPITNSSGFITGELVGRNLYVLDELITFGSRAEILLFADFLKEARRQLERNLDETTIVQAVEEQFILRCRRAVESSMGGTALPQDELDKMLLDARRNFSTLARSTRVEEMNLLRLEAAPLEGLGREYDEICKIAKVQAVRVSNDCIIVSTDVLYCEDERTKNLHEIGAFEIYLFTTPTRPPKWFNKTRLIRSMNAPHVNKEGNGCLGNTADLFPKLIAQRQFAAAVELAIAFVESANTSDSWGSHINSWPVARRAQASARR
ncbi:MAG TPA: hypothetical protein V6D17_23435 [Candidatus Obscuribacterales bacterium]